jgi:SPP1 family predicted phage head-tail adaptor
MIAAGSLRDLVEIRQRWSSVDEIGQPIETWDTVATVWADIRHQTGMEAIKAGAEVSTVKASIRIRYRADIDAGMRVYAGATVYDIVAVLSHQRIALDLACQRVT